MDQPRDQRINVRVTAQDLERIKAAAEKCHRSSPADFCRAAAMEKVEMMEKSDGK